MKTEDILRLKERVEIATEVGESHYREFKSAFEGPYGKKSPRDVKEVCYDIAKTLVAFANADGGELYIGIEDDHQITGIPYQKGELLDTLLKAPENYVLKDCPLSIKRAQFFEYDEKQLLYFSVDKGSKLIHQTSDGKCFQRKDRNSEPVSFQRVNFARDEQRSREYDRGFEAHAKITDLSYDSVSGLLPTKLSMLSFEKLLQHWELAEYDGEHLRLRKSSLLLFAKDISAWHGRSNVRVLRVQGNEERSGRDINTRILLDTRGNILDLINEGWRKVVNSIEEEKLLENGRFVNTLPYPELAFREAYVNALLHRDYSIEGRGIEIKTFDNRLEIISPGKLLSSISIKDLESLTRAHQTRNTYLAKVLVELGYVREMGEGIERMYKLTKEYELEPPKLSTPNSSFVVTLSKKSVFSDEEIDWLKKFSIYSLTREQRQIIALGLNGRLISAKEIWDKLGLVSEDANRQLIESLNELGILENTLSKSRISYLRNKYGGDRKKVPRYKILVPTT